MRLIFLREVSADNSSDDHAVAYMDPGKKKWDNVEDWDYGRYYYQIETKAGKQKFLQTQLANIYLRHYEVAIPIAKKDRAEYRKWYSKNGFEELLGKCHSTSDSDWELCGECGHETLLPVVYYKKLHRDDMGRSYYAGGYELAVDFYKEAFADVLQDDKMVSGGCDESGVDITDEVQFYRWLTGRYRSVYVMRDPSGTWVLSSPNGGVCLVNFRNEREVPALEMPYLIDVNVSDKCSNGCDFCYKGCTAKGKQLDPETCNALLGTIKCHLPVAELVVGGGDVSEAVSNLDVGWRADVTVSTTLHWKTLIRLHDEVKLHEFCKRFMAVAVSITDLPVPKYKRVRDIISSMYYINDDIDVRVQIIPELMTVPQIKKVYKDFGHDVNLVGYKQTGRAADKDVPKLSKAFWEYLDSDTFWSYPTVADGTLCVDATFCARYKDILLKKSPYNFARLCEQEGVGSVYLDAVNNKLYKNSHSTECVDFNIQEFIKAQYPEEYFSKKLGELRGC